MNKVPLTKQEATDFFSELYGGEHHIPNYKVIEWGDGWYVRHYGDMSTFDFVMLTTFVLMCHSKCIRGEIRPHTWNEIKLIIHKRHVREGGISERHPTIETAIENFNKRKLK